MATSDSFGNKSIQKRKGGSFLDTFNPIPKPIHDPFSGADKMPSVNTNSWFVTGIPAFAHNLADARSAKNAKDIGIAQATGGDFANEEDLMTAIRAQALQKQLEQTPESPILPTPSSTVPAAISAGSPNLNILEQMMNHSTANQNLLNESASKVPQEKASTTPTVIVPAASSVGVPNLNILEQMMNHSTDNQNLLNESASKVPQEKASIPLIKTKDTADKQSFINKYIPNLEDRNITDKYQLGGATDLGFRSGRATDNGQPIKPYSSDELSKFYGGLNDDKVSEVNKSKDVKVAEVRADAAKNIARNKMTSAEKLAGDKIISQSFLEAQKVLAGNDTEKLNAIESIPEGTSKDKYASIMSGFGKKTNFSRRTIMTDKDMERVADAAHDGNVDILKQLSLYERGPVTAIWLRKYPEDTDMIGRVGQATFGTTTKTRQAINIIESILNKNPDNGDPDLLTQMEMAHATLGTTGSWSFLNKPINAINITSQKLEQTPELAAFNQIKNGLSAEISSAFASGGVPTDARFKNELENLQPDIPHKAFKDSIQKIRDMLEVRKATFARSQPSTSKPKDKNDFLQMAKTKTEKKTEKKTGK